jgi:hypothetical protein
VVVVVVVSSHGDVVGALWVVVVVVVSSHGVVVGVLWAVVVVSHGVVVDEDGRHKHAELAAQTFGQLLNSVGMAEYFVVVLARNESQKGFASDRSYVKASRQASG